MTRKSYPTDLTNLQWENIAHLVPPPRTGGRPRTYSNRELLNAIFYHVRAGGSWRCLPHDYPPWESAYAYFRAWQDDGTWQTIHDALRDQLRGEEGRQHEPTAAILDSQSVKTTSRGGERGYDAGKKIAGRKRHLLVDTLGLLLVVVVHAAGIQGSRRRKTRA